jgi:nitrogen PTS system EIIA component
MKLASMIQLSLVFPDILGRDKASVLRQISEAISQQFPELHAQELFSFIMERERLCSTGIGGGIAIPHAKLPQAKKHIVAFARSRSGVMFDSIDDKPVHLIFVVVGPEGANEIHLQTLARISKFLHDTSFREKLFTADHASHIYEVILGKDSQY